MPHGKKSAASVAERDSPRVYNWLTIAERLDRGTG